MQAEAIHDFEPMGLDRESQLRLVAGDQLQVLVQDETGWWAGHREGSDVTGWFPRSCVTLLSECAAPSVSPVSRALSTRNGRRVASPQVAGATNLRSASRRAPAMLRKQAEPPSSGFMKLHTNPTRSPRHCAAATRAASPPVAHGFEAPSSAGSGAAAASQSALLENMAKAFEVERRFAKGLEEELRCLRELSTKEVHLAALEKAWQAPPEPASIPSATVSSQKAQTPKVRDLVAAFEQRGKSGGDQIVPQNLAKSYEL